MSSTATDKTKSRSSPGLLDILVAAGFNLYDLKAQILRELREECGTTEEDIQVIEKYDLNIRAALKRQMMAVVVGVMYRQAIDFFIEPISRQLTGTENESELAAVDMLARTATALLSYHVLDDDARRKAKGK